MKLVENRPPCGCRKRVEDIGQCERLGAKKGVFGACMGVALINDGPVTVMLEVEPAG